MDKDKLQEWRDIAKTINQLCISPHWNTERRYEIERESRKLVKMLETELGE